MSWARCPRCRRTGAGAGWLRVDFWKTLGYGGGESRRRSSAHPRSRLGTMGQQLGLPAARATTQEVLGAGGVEPFTRRWRC
ncbi:hypothetical protein BKA66DRAFT_424455 [Pyrenochaeta sp. MPI-SDFR-AT-0127]|nr:hypothetical protein BKA66DRAFT_424455 [Pyrenochaeta sp. MPI-SDFR-AT-0127]